MKSWIVPFSMGHFPNLPSQQFRGQSRIGQYGDELMEGDYHVGQILDTLKELGVDENTLVVFASDNGPQGETVREMGNQGTPDMGNSGPFRGELGEATEGSIRTFCFIRWPGKVKPGTTSYAMFSTMDFFPTFASLIGSKMPTDRPIDGVDQTDVLLGQSETGNRDSLLTFIGADMVAVRWKQWRMYFTDVHPTGIGPQREPGMFSASAPMAGYPKIYNIEMEPARGSGGQYAVRVDGRAYARSSREVIATSRATLRTYSSVARTVSIVRPLSSALSPAPHASDPA
jgi:Sulfatase